MDWKKLYALLESSEEGKKLLEEIKPEVDKLKDADAKFRKADGENKILTATTAELKKLVEKFSLSGSGNDGDDGDGDDNKPAPTDADKQLKLVRKQMKAMEDKVKEMEKAGEEAKKQATTEKLRADFGGALREHFGKYGETLSENLILRGQVKVLDGAIIYEDGDKAYDLKSAVEALKVAHKEYLVPKGPSSAMPPPTTRTAPTGPCVTVPKTAEEAGKMSATDWFKAGRATAGAA